MLWQKSSEVVNTEFFQPFRSNVHCEMSRSCCSWQKNPCECPPPGSNESASTHRRSVNRRVKSPSPAVCVSATVATEVGSLSTATPQPMKVQSSTQESLTCVLNWIPLDPETFVAV